METIQPIFELKVNSEYYETIDYDDALDSDKIILQSFTHEDDWLYICINSTQLKVKKDELIKAVNFFK